MAKVVIELEDMDGTVLVTINMGSQNPRMTSAQCVGVAAFNAVCGQVKNIYGVFQDGDPHGRLH